MSLASLLNHPYVSEEGTFAPSTGTPGAVNPRSQVRAVLDALRELGHTELVSNFEVESRERDLVERVIQRKGRCGSGNTADFKDGGGGGHSLSRMTPTSSAGFYSR
jgi:hypothetical protein